MADSPILPGAGKRVLIVDDSEITIRLIESELDGKGFEVLTATRAEEASQLIIKKATRPHLVLLDINMPNIDGAQFCKFIKGNAMFTGIKVVFCSGMDESQLKALAEECGADGYVTKDSFLGKWVRNHIE
jgi:CheY-like chemotaxis protein